MSESALTGPVYFRIAPKLRRCAIYVIIASFFLAPVYVWVTCFVRKHGAFHTSLGLAIFLIPALTMVVALRWALRVDHQGVACCSVFGWDLWKWSDFASGRIHKRYPYTFVDGERPWWRKRLRLGHMSQDDIRKALDLINAHYQLPRPPELPESLTVKYRFRRSATFDRNGVHVLVSGQPHEYLWDAIRRVHIVRMDSLRRDFKSLTIVLPDQQIELRMITHQGGTSPSWRGATAEEVNEFLRQYVAEERIDLDIHGERPERRTDIEKQLAEAMKTIRDFRIMLCVVVPLFAATLIWMAIRQNLIKTILMGTMLAVFPGSFLWFLHGMLRQRCLKLEAMVASCDGNGEGNRAGNHAID